MTSSFTVTPDAIVPAAEVAAAAVARTPARWHWDEKKEGSAAIFLSFQTEFLLKV